MVRIWRVAIRLLLVAIITVGVGPPTLLITVAMPRRPRLRARIGARATHLWSRLVLRTLGVRLTCNGTPPPPGVMVVANHLSYLDIPVLAACYPTLFLSKAEVARWPMIGFFAHAAGTLFIDRDQTRDTGRVFGELSVWLRAGERITWFPESTTSPGAAVAPFKPSLFQAAIRAGVPCHPVTLRPSLPGGGVDVSEVVCWHGSSPLGSHARRLLTLEHIDYAVTFGDPVLPAGDRKLLARQLHDAVASAFVPVERR